MSSHRCWVMVAGSPPTTPVPVVIRQFPVGPEEARRSSSASHSSELIPGGMAMELDTRNPLLPAEETTSSPGTSPPELNWARSVQVPSNSSTFHLSGTSKWYECLSETNSLDDGED